MPSYCFSCPTTMGIAQGHTYIRTFGHMNIWIHGHTDTQTRKKLSKFVETLHTLLDNHHHHSHCHHHDQHVAHCDIRPLPLYQFVRLTTIDQSASLIFILLSLSFTTLSPALLISEPYHFYLSGCLTTIGQSAHFIVIV